METKNIIIVVVLLVLIGIGAWALLFSQKGIDMGTVPSGQEDGKEAESLTEIFAKAKGVSSLKYDMVATAPGEAAITTKMWQKGKKMRMEGTFDGQNMDYLVDADKQTAYMYMPAENMAMKMGLSNAHETVGESPTEQSESVMKYNPVTVGAEVIDGKSCLVIEYITETYNVKTWVWTEYGLPIRTESTTAKGTSVAELKNIEFGNIPDSMFELPAGVQMMELPFGL